MPNYNYVCRSCDQTVTVNRGINDPEHLPRCLKCEAQMTRVYELPAVTFKGNGWGANSSN